MNKLTLSSVLLVALVTPLIMNYRLSTGDTPYFLFGLIFLSLLSFVSLDLFFKFKIEILNRLKLILFWIILTMTIGTASYSAIVVRHQSSPIYGVHDIIVQQELALRLLIHGKNPYSATYFGTPLEKWHYSDTEINPALYHFVMQPLYLIFPLPFYFAMTRTFGFFDARIPLLFLLVFSLFVIQKLLKDPDKRLQFMTLFAFNPANLSYFLEGRDDIFMFSFMLLSFYFLYKNRNSLGGVALALAFAIKQSAWPIFPFYFFYLFFKNGGMRNIKKTLFQILPFIITFSLITLPFVLWNAKAYLDSTILYLSGNTANSYPIAGYGFGKLLNQIGFIKDVHSYFPFWIPQIILGFPFLLFLIKWMKRENSVRKLILVYALFLFVFWYFSRYFNNSHLGYISIVLITAYFWPLQESK